MHKDEIPLMITTGFIVEPQHTIESAPKYDESVTLIKVDKAIIVEKGTIDNNPTVDLQCSDIDGKKYVIMATGGILKMLISAIKGVENRV